MQYCFYILAFISFIIAISFLLKSLKRKKSGEDKAFNPGSEVEKLLSQILVEVREIRNLPTTNLTIFLVSLLIGIEFFIAGLLFSFFR
jgi:hypothetical protein